MFCFHVYLAELKKVEHIFQKRWNISLESSNLVGNFLKDGTFRLIYVLKQNKIPEQMLKFRQKRKRSANNDISGNVFYR